MKDPIVEKVRRFRDEHARQFGYDLDAICEDYKAHQIQVGKRLVRLKPKTIFDKTNREIVSLPNSRAVSDS
jgi:hypothetical protein